MPREGNRSAIPCATSDTIFNPIKNPVTSSIVNPITNSIRITNSVLKSVTGCRSMSIWRLSRRGNLSPLVVVGLICFIYFIYLRSYEV